MERTLFRFIFKHSLRQQIIITALTVISFPFLYYSLVLPKTIINDAIQGRGFPKVVYGFELDQKQYLLFLSILFLILVFVNGGFKYYINVFKNKTGERMLRRLRYDLYARMLRFPLHYFRRNPVGQLIPIVTSEVEPLGGFIGESFATPAFTGGQLLVTLAFMCVQDPWLGLTAIALYPVQIWLIPKLQARVNNLSKIRVRMIRRMSEQLNETANGLQEIQVSGSAKFKLAEFSSQLGANYYNRYNIFQLKFFIKFLNNFIAQLTPFFFYAIGGYLVIEGDLSFGSLVAVLAAYKDLGPQWRDLLDFYQSMEDARIKYDQVVQMFEPTGMIPPARQIGDPPAPTTTGGGLEARAISLIDDGGFRTLDGLSLSIPRGDHVAVVGAPNAGKHELAMVLCGLADPTSGQMIFDGVDMKDMPHSVASRRIGYVGPNSVLFSASLFDNLVFGLQVRPNERVLEDRLASQRRKREIIEAELTGNSPDDIEADWIDYAAAGADTRESLTARLLETFELAELTEELRDLGLRSTIEPEMKPQIVADILAARSVIVEALHAPDLVGKVEPFYPDRFNNMASIGENIVFGRPTDDRFDLRRLGSNPFLIKVLDDLGLTESFTEIGRKVAALMVEMFATVTSNTELFERFSFVEADELNSLKAVLRRLETHAGVTEPGGDDRATLISMMLRIIPARHRFGYVDDAFRAQVLRARAAFAAELPKELSGALEFHDLARYSRGATIQDNLLFGRVAPGQLDENGVVRQRIVEALDRVGLRQRVISAIIEVGLSYDVGPGGSRLAPILRQKLAVARAVLKRPELLIMDEPFSALDTVAQTRMVERILSSSPDRTVVWVLHRPSIARHFKRVVVMAAGQVVEQGAFDDLNHEGSLLHNLLQAE